MITIITTIISLVALTTIISILATNWTEPYTVPFKKRDDTPETVIYIAGERFDNPLPDIWTERCKSWLEAGAQIKHIIVQPSELTQTRSSELQNHFAKFETFVIPSPKDIEDPKLQEYAYYIINSHITLWDNPRRQMAWLETTHHPKEKYAYNCEFIDKNRGRYDERITNHRQNILGLIELTKCYSKKL